MRALAATLLLVACAASAQADVVIQDIAWGFRQAPKIAIGPGAFLPIERWTQRPIRKLPAIPRVAVTLVNNGKTVEGIVLRFAVTAKVANIKDPTQQGDWGLPFWISEQRVPLVMAGRSVQVPITDLHLITSLGDMYRAGFWPMALKIQVLIKVRRGDPLPHQISEKEVAVGWKSEP